MGRVVRKKDVWLRASVSLITGLAIFVAIGLVALFIQFLADYVTELILLPNFVKTALNLTSKAIIGIDVLLLLAFLIRAVNLTILGPRAGLRENREYEEDE